MFRAVFAPEQRIVEPLLRGDAGIAVVVGEDRAVGGDHVEHPFAARTQVYPFGLARKSVRPPPVRQGFRIDPCAPDRGHRGLDGAVDHHRPGGEVGQVCQPAAKAVAIAVGHVLGHVLGQRGQLHRDGDPAASIGGGEIGCHERRRQGFAHAADHFEIHAAGVRGKVEPTRVNRHHGLSLDFAERGFAFTRRGGVGQVFDRHFGRGR